MIIQDNQFDKDIIIFCVRGEGATSIHITHIPNAPSASCCV